MEKSKEIMMKIDNLLSDLWVVGDISSYQKKDILERFPPRLREMV